MNPTDFHHIYEEKYFNFLKFKYYIYDENYLLAGIINVAIGGCRGARTK